VYSGITSQCHKIFSNFKYKLTTVPQPINLMVSITLLVTFLKQLSEFYFLSNREIGSL
jgi:hypothetical protein